MKASKASFLSRALSLVAAASIFVQGPVAVAMECDGKVWFEIADKRKGKVNVEKQLANTEEKLKQLEAGNAPVPPAKSVAAKEAQATSVIGEKLQGELNALGLKAATRNSSTKVDAPGPGLKEIESGLVKGFEKESGGMYNIRNGARVEGSIKQEGAQPHFVTDFHTSPKLAPLRDFARGLKEANVPQEEKIGRIVEFIQRKALVGKSYGDRKYNQLLAQYRNAGKDIPLSAYMDCKAGVCRENALYTHFALKEAGVDNLYVYANVKQRNRILGRALTEQNEDHAFVIVKHKGDDYIVDSYNENFHGYSFSQLKDPALTPSTKLKRAEYAGSPDPFTFRAVNKVNPFPAVWQPLDEIDGAKALSRASATLIKETPSTAARDAERIARGAFKNEAEFAESVKEIRKLNAGIRGARDSYVWNRFDALREVVTKAKEEQYRAEGVVKHLMAKENDIGKIQKNPAYIEAKAFDRFVVEAENRLARMPQPPAKAAESVRASGPRSFKIGTQEHTLPSSASHAVSEALSSNEKVLLVIGDIEGNTKFLDAYVEEGLLKKAPIRLSRKDTFQGYEFTDMARALAKEGKLEVQLMGDLVNGQYSARMFANLKHWEADLLANKIDPGPVVRTSLGNHDTAKLNFLSYMEKNRDAYKISLKGAPDSPVARVKYFYSEGMGISGAFGNLRDEFKTFLQARVPNAKNISEKRMNELAEMAAARWFENAASRADGSYVALMTSDSSALARFAGEKNLGLLVSHSGATKKNVGFSAIGSQTKKLLEWSGFLRETQHLFGDQIGLAHIRTLFTRVDSIRPDAKGVLRVEKRDLELLEKQNRAAYAELNRLAKANPEVQAMLDGIRAGKTTEIAYNKQFDTVLNLLTDSKYGALTATKEQLSRISPSMRSALEQRHPKIASFLKDVEEKGTASFFVNAPSEASMTYGVRNMDNGPPEVVAAGGYKGTKVARAPADEETARLLAEQGVKAQVMGHTPVRFFTVVRSKPGLPPSYYADTSFQSGKAPRMFINPESGKVSATSYGELLVDGKPRPIRIETGFDPANPDKHGPIGLIHDGKDGPYNIIGRAFDEETGKDYGFIGAHIDSANHKPDVIAIPEAELGKARLASITESKEELTLNRDGALLGQKLKGGKIAGETEEFGNLPEAVLLNHLLSGGHVATAEKELETLISAEVQVGKQVHWIAGGSDFSAVNSGDPDALLKYWRMRYMSEDYHKGGEHPGHLKIFGGTNKGSEYIERLVHQEALAGKIPGASPELSEKIRKVAEKQTYVGRSNFDSPLFDYLTPPDWDLSRDILYIVPREVQAATNEDWDGTFSAMNKLFMHAVNESTDPKAVAARAKLGIAGPQLDVMGGGGTIERGVAKVLAALKSEGANLRFNVNLMEKAGSSGKLLDSMSERVAGVKSFAIDADSLVAQQKALSGELIARSASVVDSSRTSSTRVLPAAKLSEAELAKVQSAADIARFVKEANPEKHLFVKDAPVIGYKITSDNFEDIPEAIRKHLISTDQKPYTKKYLQENQGSVIALQMNGTKPDFYIIGKETYEAEYAASSMAEVAAKNGKYNESLRPHIAGLASGRDPNLVAVLKTKPTELIKMTDLGFPLDRRVVAQSPWGEPVKPIGQDAYLAWDKRKQMYYMVNVGEDGLPLHYQPSVAKAAVAPPVEAAPATFVERVKATFSEAYQSIARRFGFSSDPAPVAESRKLASTDLPRASSTQIASKSLFAVDPGTTRSIVDLERLAGSSKVSAAVNAAEIERAIIAVPKNMAHNEQIAKAVRQFSHQIAWEPEHARKNLAMAVKAGKADFERAKTEVQARAAGLRRVAYAMDPPADAPEQIRRFPAWPSSARSLEVAANELEAAIFDVERMASNGDTAGLARAAEKPVQVGQRADLSSIRASATTVKGATKLPPSALEGASPEVKRASSFADAVRNHLRNAGNSYLKSRDPADFERYQALAKKYPQFEAPIVYTTEEGRRAELYRRELARLELDANSLKEAIKINPTSELKEQLADVRRKQAITAVVSVGEADRKVDPKKAAQIRKNAILAAIGDQAVASQSHLLSGKNPREIVSGPEASLNRSYIDRQRLDNFRQAQETRVVMIDELAASLAGGDPQRAKGMAMDLQNLHSGKIKKDNLVKDRGWSSPEVDRCFTKGSFCAPELTIPNQKELASSASLEAQEVMLRKTIESAGPEGAALARAIAPPRGVTAADDPFKGTATRLAKEAQEMEKELKVVKAKPELAAQAADMEAAHKALKANLDLVRAEEKVISDAKPLALKAKQQDNATVNALIEVLGTYDNAALKAKLAEAGVVARAEEKGFEKFAMKGIVKGDDRLDLFQGVNEWMGAADEATVLKVNDFLAHELSKKPGFEKILAVGAESELAALQKSRALVRATGVSDGRLAAAVQTKAGISDLRQSLLRVTGTNADDYKPVLVATAEAQSLDRKVAAEVAQQIAQRDEGANGGRKLASVASPAEVKALAKDDTALLSADQIAKVAADELKILADRSGTRVLDDATQKALVNAAKVVEQGGNASDVRLSVTRIAAFSDKPEMFDSARDAYLQMAKVLQENPALRKQPNWRQLVMEKAVDRMLRSPPLSFGDEAIKGKPPEPGMLARTMACLKL